MNFTHLHVHSYYSPMRGVSSIEELCEAAQLMGMSRIALTDTNGLYGLIFFLEIAKEHKLEPIVGAELVTEKHRAVLLVKDSIGYSNLCRLISERHCNDQFDPLKSIQQYRDGLIIITDDRPLLRVLKRQARDDLYVEMSPGYGMHEAYAYSRESGIPPVATNRVYFVNPEQYSLHKVLRAVDLNTKLSRLTEKDLCRPHSSLRSASAMHEQFPHAPHAVENSERIADECKREWEFSETIFPEFQQLGHQQAFDRLKEMTYEGAYWRYGEVTPEIQKRIEYELSLIGEKKYAHYFLTVYDIVKQNPRTCGRGSAAASIVSFCLGITHVDPIKYNLFFERFLNHGRTDPPDIDVDFAWDERDKIFDYVFAKYGTQRAAMVSNHVGFQTRAAVREVAKVYGMPDGEIQRISKRLARELVP
ncbi:MAG TPA: PHP domain-containing protein, partial [Bdellovibrionota bacterium]|nr:PHP domain-containing protein [Bdellovibrionota bacterium]